MSALFRLLILTALTFSGLACVCSGAGLAQAAPRDVAADHSCCHSEGHRPESPADSHSEHHSGCQHCGGSRFTLTDDVKVPAVEAVQHRLPPFAFRSAPAVLPAARVSVRAVPPEQPTSRHSIAVLRQTCALLI